MSFLYKIVAEEGLHIEAGDLVQGRPMLMIRGAGEIGLTSIEFLQQLANLSRDVEVVLALRAGAPGQTAMELLEQDRFADKFLNRPMTEPGDFTRRSNYWYRPGLLGINSTGDPSVVAVRGRHSTFPLRVVYMGDAVVPQINGRRPDLVVDATGKFQEYSKGDEIGKKDPRNYLRANPDWADPLFFFAAPGKGFEKATGQSGFHLLEGINIGNGIPSGQALSLDEVIASRLVFTGSCSTHAGTVAIEALSRHIPDMVILDGGFISNHARTPSDNEAMLDNNMIPQSTGFASAAKVVLKHVSGVKQIDSGPPRADRENFFGSSLFTMPLVIASSTPDLTTEKVVAMLREEAQGRMRNQLAILKPAVFTDKKKGGLQEKDSFPIHSAAGLKGDLHTTVFDPTAITVKRLPGDGPAYLYSVSITGWYDNVGGFTVSFLREAGAMLAHKRGLASNPVSDQLPTDWRFIDSGHPKAVAMFGEDPLNKPGLDGSLIETYPG